MGCSLIGANKEDLQYVGQLCRCIQQQLQRLILEVDVFTGYSTYALFLHHPLWGHRGRRHVMVGVAAPCSTRNFNDVVWRALDSER